jgi:hypothetical protein
MKWVLVVRLMSAWHAFTGRDALMGGGCGHDFSTFKHTTVGREELSCFFQNAFTAHATCMLVSRHVWDHAPFSNLLAFWHPCPPNCVYDLQTPRLRPSSHHSMHAEASGIRHTQRPSGVWALTRHCSRHQYRVDAAHSLYIVPERRSASMAPRCKYRPIERPYNQPTT